MIIFDGLLKMSAKILINILLIEFLVFIFKNCKQTIKSIIRNGFERLNDCLQRRKEG